MDQHAATQPDEPKAATPSSVDAGAEPPQAASPPPQVQPQDLPPAEYENRALDLDKGIFGFLRETCKTWEGIRV